jgi:hypothetical protein
MFLLQRLYPSGGRDVQVDVRARGGELCATA